MKFIPGMRFINRTNLNTSHFKKNKLYILQDIKKIDQKIVYTFLVDGEYKKVKFESLNQADNWLESIIV